MSEDISRNLSCSVEVLQKSKMNVKEEEENIIQPEESAWYAGCSRTESKII